MNSFSFDDKDPRITSLKPGLALRLLSKGLFYIRAMVLETISFTFMNARIKSKLDHFVPYPGYDS